MPRLTLICHAVTADTRSGAFPGDEALDARAIAGLAHASFRPGRLERCQASPARRALETATGLGLAPTVEPLLRECDYGTWTGQPIAAVHDRDPDGVARWRQDPAAAPHGGESLLALLDRIAPWLSACREGDGIVAVTHASVIRAAVVLALRAPPGAFWQIDVAPLSLTRLSTAGLQWTLSRLNLPVRRSERF